jgi:branched-chain amino acid transport system permease protein
VLVAIYIMLASSLNLLIGYSGLVSLGHTAFFGVGAYVSGYLTTRSGWPVVAGVAAAVLATFVLGHVAGRVALRLRGASFVIATLALAEGLRLIALNWQPVTGGPAGLIGIPTLSIGGAELLQPGDVYPVMFAIAIALVMITSRLVHSRLGMSLLAMREHELLAQAVGIHPEGAARRAYVISGAMAGLAGGLYAHYVGFVSPEIFSFTLMITMLLMVVAGGLGTIMGPVIGAVAFTLLPEALRFSDQWRLVIYGAILLAIVRFAPRGIWGTFVGVAGALRGVLGGAPSLPPPGPPPVASRESSQEPAPVGGPPA